MPKRRILSFPSSKVSPSTTLTGPDSVSAVAESGMETASAARHAKGMATMLDGVLGCAHESK